MLFGCSDDYLGPQSFELFARGGVVYTVFAVAIELLKWTVVLVPCGGVDGEDCIRTLVWYATSVAESDGSINHMETDVLLVEGEIHFSFLVELSSDVD